MKNVLNFRSRLYIIVFSFSLLNCSYMSAHESNIVYIIYMDMVEDGELT